MSEFATPDLPASVEEVWDISGDRWIRVEDIWFVPESHADVPRHQWVDVAVPWPELIAESGPLSDVPLEGSAA